MHHLSTTVLILRKRFFTWSNLHWSPFSFSFNVSLSFAHLLSLLLLPTTVLNVFHSATASWLISSDPSHSASFSPCVALPDSFSKAALHIMSFNSLLKKLGDSCLLWWMLTSFLWLSRLSVIWTYSASLDVLLSQINADQTKFLKSFQNRLIPIPILFLILLRCFQKWQAGKHPSLFSLHPYAIHPSKSHLQSPLIPTFGVLSLF